MGAINFSIDAQLLAVLTRELPLEIFVETGTYHGDSTEVARGFFRECHTVEMAAPLYQAATARFAGQPDIHLHQGDSAGYLRAQQERFASRPVLFWLDAHWCGDGTASGDAQSPLLAELQAIQTLHANSVLMVDDARLYLCPPGRPHRFTDWPDLTILMQRLLALSSQHRLMVYNDVILLYPATIQTVMARHAHEHSVDWLQIADDARAHQRRKARKFWRLFP